MNPILAQALELLPKCGWDQFDLTQVAVASKQPLYTVQEQFDDKYGVVQALYLYVNATIDLDAECPDENLHDWLFELFMDRFDVLDKFRPALTELQKHITSDLKLARLIACNLHDWMSRVAERLPESSQIIRAVRAATLCLIYAAALETWLGDDSVDSSHTMATLDQRLSGFEIVLGSS